MISVLMSVYDEEKEHLELAINSILQQTYDDLELIIINDNPQNDKFDKYFSEIIKKDSRVKVVDNERNIGLPKSLNRAFSLSKGDYVARMDADDISKMNRLEIQMDFLKNNPHIDLVASSTIDIDEDGIIIKKNKPIELSHKQIIKTIKYSSVLRHPTWLMKRSLYNDINGYRDIKFGQDYDFLYRAIDSGFHLYLLNDVLLEYRVRSNSIGSSNGMKQYLSSQYIKELHKRRLKLQDDNFSVNEWYTWVNVLEVDQNKFNLVHKYFRENDNSSILKICKKIMIGTAVSKYYRQLMINRLQLKICLLLIGV